MTDHLVQEDIHGTFSTHLWHAFFIKGVFSRNLSTVIFSNYLTLNSLKYKKSLIKTNTLLSKYQLPQIYLGSV